MMFFFNILLLFFDFFEYLISFRKVVYGSDYNIGNTQMGLNTT